MKVWVHSFASLRITVGLLVVLLVALAAGTIVESVHGAEAAQRSVYAAAWFHLLLAAFALNLSCSITDLWPWGRQRIGYVLTHGSMLLVLAGALATDLYKTEGVLAIWEGETQNTLLDRDGSPASAMKLPFAVRLDSFEIDFYPGTRRPAQFRSRVTVLDTGKSVPAVIEMNRALDYGGFRFFQSSYRQAPERDQTILSVARDPGQALAFLGYFGVVGGMIVVFATRIGQRRRAGVALALALAAFARPAHAQSVPSAADVDALRRLPVQHDGRVMPLDTVAREAVFNVTGRRSVFGHDPVAVALGWSFDPEAWLVQPIVAVDASLAAAVGLPAGTRWASFGDLVRNGALGGLVQSARAADAEERPLSSLQKSAQKLEARLLAMQGFLDGSALAVIPAAEPGAPWSPASDLRSVADLRAVLASGAAAHVADPDAIEREIGYNRARPTRLAWWILAAALALSLLAWRKARRALDLAAFVLLLAGFAVMSWGIGVRWQIAGRIPASNMYESLLFLGWGVGFFAFVASAFLRNRLVILNAAAMSALTMALSDLLPIDPFIHPMPPVLAGTYWLAVHVPIIMVGYAVLALGVVVAHMQIGAELLARRREVALRMNELLYWYVMVGSILLLAGILTGSMWAAESWGRYWGWDPKEVWSLVAFLAYVAILHARAERLVGPFGMAAWSIVAFQTILMTYLGVNFVLASGLHSYGFGESSVVTWMLVVLLAELGFVGAGWLFLRRRRAAAADYLRTAAA